MKTIKPLLGTFVLVLAMVSTSYTTANPTSPEIPEIDAKLLCRFLEVFDLTDSDYYKLFCQAPPQLPSCNDGFSPTSCNPTIPDPAPLPEGPCTHRPELCIAPEAF